MYKNYNPQKNKFSPIFLSDPAGGVVSSPRDTQTVVTATTSVMTGVNGGTKPTTSEEVLVGGVAIKGKTTAEVETTTGSVWQRGEVDDRKSRSDANALVYQVKDSKLITLTKSIKPMKVGKILPI